MQSFRKWLEFYGDDDESVEIRGEYWIQDGNVDFADGDVGDYNHEQLAVEWVFHQFLDSITDLADDLNIEYEDLNKYVRIDIEGAANLLSEIVMNYISEEEAAQQIGANQEAMDILLYRNSIDPRVYVMKYDGWIAVRGNNVEVYGYDARKQKNLISGLEEILYQEYPEAEEAQVADFTMHDFATNRSTDFRLEDLKNPQPMARPQTPATTKGDRRFTITSRDEEENTPQSQKSVPNQWNVYAQKRNMIPAGQQLWRGTSESKES